MNNDNSKNAAGRVDWKRARTILARSFYNELRSNGYSTNQIIEFSSELLGLVTENLRTPAAGEPAKRLAS